MKVKKRNGDYEEVSFDKVTNRIKFLCNMLPKLSSIDPIVIAQKVNSEIYEGVETSNLDELAAEICTYLITTHPEYGILASRLIISNNHKLTSPSFSETIYNLHKISQISDEVYSFVINNKDKLNSYIKYNRDYNFDYFGFKTLEKAYLKKINNKIVERIQHLLMRVSIGIHVDDMKSVLDTYNYMSQKYFIHATPTLFHSGTPRAQLLSCFLMGMEDSVDGIYKVISDCAKISKWAGGIGISIQDIRAKNSVIKSTNGKSNGIMPMLKVLNDTARHINQSGKRNGSFAVYLEPWHADIISFLEAKKNHGDENDRARDLFYGLWIPDLFMERVENNKNWSLFCPDQASNLSNLYGDEFNKLYLKYEKNKNLVIKNIPARDIWKKIIESQIETGTPYMLYKDAANKKSNQNNLGTIKSSNLCTEIIEYSNNEQYSCCTLASLGLPMFIKKYNYDNISKIQIFTKKNCKFCKYAKSYLNKKKIEYNELEDKNILLETFKQLNIKNGKITYPQIFINYKDNKDMKYIGGFNELIVFFKPKFDFIKLFKVTKIITRNLNKIIDKNYYPVPETRYSNKLHRPLGIGVQGLADLYSKMRIGFDEDEAFKLNKQIFATIYYASLEASMELAKYRKKHLLKIKTLKKIYNIDTTVKANEYKTINNKIVWLTGNGNKISENKELNNLVKEYLPINEELNNLDEKHIGSYSSFKNSYLYDGKFQFDLWEQKPLNNVPGLKLNWDKLRNDIRNNGIRNSLLLAPMPTASTSQILGNNECIEPFTSNIYARNTLAGSFVVVNKYLLNDLININIWNTNLKNKLIENRGSIQNIKEIPDIFKKIYKISWDLSQKHIIDQSADRAIYICQSQSLNLFLKNANMSNISSMHMYSWKKGLKTGIYYMRTKSIVKSQQFSIEPTNKATCDMCSG